MARYLELLRRQVQEKFGDDPVLAKLIDPELAERLGFSLIECEVLMAFLMKPDPDNHEPTLAQLAEATGYRESVVAAVCEELVERGAAFWDEDRFVGQAVLCLETSLLEQPTGEYAYQLTQRPLRSVLITWARDGGLGRVYGLLFGGKPNWPLLKKIENLLGSDRAALLLLENANRVFEGDPLKDLIAFAQQEAKRGRRY